MAEWLILLLLVPAIVVPVVLLVGFAGCTSDYQDFDVARPGGNGDGNGPPDPVIDSAEGKSVSIITLKWMYGGAAANFQIERSGQILPLPYPDSSPFDDTGLEAETSYSYKVLALDGNGDPLSNWSNEVVGKTLPFELTLESWPDPDKTPYIAPHSEGWEGYTLVQRIEPIRLSTSGTKVRITLRASSVSDASIDRIYISQPKPNPTNVPTINPYDSEADLTAVTTTPIFIAQGQPFTIPVTLTGIDYKLDEGMPLLIAVDFAPSPPSGVAYIETVPEEAAAYWEFGVAEATTPDGVRSANYQQDTPAAIYLIEKIEVG
jgi:hypothetical protein